MSQIYQCQTEDSTEARLAFEYKHVKCWVCGKEAGRDLGNVGLDVHEIARGPARSKAVTEPCTWVRVCRLCHEALDDYLGWPVARALALKYLCDRENYDRVRVNLLRGRDAQAITEKEVQCHVKFLRRTHEKTGKRWPG